MSVVVAAATGVDPEAAREGNEVEAAERANGATTGQDNPLFQATGADWTTRVAATD